MRAGGRRRRYSFAEIWAGTWRSRSWSRIRIRSRYGLARVLVDNNSIGYCELSQRGERRSLGVHDLKERNGLDDLSNEGRCSGSCPIGRIFVCGGHVGPFLEIRVLVGVELVVAGPGARDGVMGILMVQMVMTMTVCVSVFVCRMSVDMSATTGLKE